MDTSNHGSTRTPVLEINGVISRRVYACTRSRYGSIATTHPGMFPSVGTNTTRSCSHLRGFRKHTPNRSTTCTSYVRQMLLSHWKCLRGSSNSLSKFSFFTVTWPITEGHNRKAWTGGVRAWDHVHQEEVVVIPFVCALLGDNPMQSEFACHIGSKGKLFCRMCTVSSGMPAEQVPTTSGSADDSDPPSTDPPPDPSAEESDPESIPESVASAGSTGATKSNKLESMQGMIDRVTRFVSVCLRWLR